METTTRTPLTRRPRGRLRIGLGALLAASLVVAACGDDGDDTAEATPSSGGEATETVLVGSTLDLAPMEFVDESGEEVGFEPDLLTAIGEELGITFEYVKTPFDQAFTGLQADKYRVNASAIFVRCERVNDKEGVGEFTVPYFEEGQLLTIREEDEGEISSLEDLEGKTLGVESAGSTADAVADENIGIGYTKEIFPDNNALFLALEQGRVDAALQSGAVSRYTIRDRPALAEAGVIEETVRPVAMVFRADDSMRDDFNEAIDTLKENGQLSEIYEEWFGTAPEAGSPTVEIVPEVTPETCQD